MSKRPSGRIVAAALVVMVWVMAAPVKAHAAPATWDSITNPTAKLWSAVVDWFRSLWSEPTAGTRLPGDGKCGALHGNDGLSNGRAGDKGTS